MSALTLLVDPVTGNATGWGAAPTMGASGSGASAGGVPLPDATQGATKYLCEDATWRDPTVKLREAQEIEALTCEAAAFDDVRGFEIRGGSR